MANCCLFAALYFLGLTFCLGTDMNVNHRKDHSHSHSHSREKERTNKLNSVDEERKIEYAKSVNRVMAQKELFASGQSKFEMSINKFANMTPGEKISFLGVPPGPKNISVKAVSTPKSLRVENARFFVPPTFPLDKKTKSFGIPRASKIRVKGANGLPAYMDYRDTGFVTNVKNQGSCGSCWSFSTTGVLEGQMPQLRSLAEQQLVDCATIDSPYGGCDGAWPENAMKWMQSNTIQLGLQDNYPYKAQKNSCPSTQLVGVKVKSVEIIPAGDENSLMAAVANKGPVSVCLNADDLFLYSSGIYDNQQCSKSVNHAVLVVGYGSENGQDYWVVKNSWGEDWGENGFIRMARGSNICGIAANGVHATIEQDPGSKLECVDQSPYCLSWAKSGYCSTSVDYMSEKCKAACTKCSKPRIYIRSCADKNPQCAAWAANGDCTNYWQYMLYNCPKACEICTKWIGYYLYPDWLLKAASV